MKINYHMPLTSFARVLAGLLSFQLCFFAFSNLAIAQSSVSFSISALSGETLASPTSLQFGPDNRLYVAQQNGVINVYTIKKNAPNNYSVTATESIQLIKNIPNHDDNGVLNTSVTTRQITGILVVGTATVPVIYVSSSDSRIGGGGTAGDKNLDTNSGIISKLTKNGSSWVKVDVVKGLPRSEENHSTNGLVLDAATNTLYVASGGHTNAGSPSNNFAFLTEYALSAAILKVNLSMITSQFGGSYTLPTLDDPSRANSGGSDVNDPWGGNDGLNQAKLVAGGPVQIHSAGYRNAYDLVLTKVAGKAGRMYTIDNGANAGWGGYPDKEGTSGVTNKYVTGEPGSTTAGVNDAKVNNLDNLHLVSAPGMTPIYGGHPNPIRANPSGAGIYTFNNTTGAGTFSLTPTSDWPPVPLSMAKPVEADYRNPGVNDGALYTWVASTNGIAEYTSQAFNGALLGDLLAASFDGNIYRIKLNTAGTAISSVTKLAGGFGSQPLDVTAQPDNAIFPGTIWAATYGANSITILEPAVSSNCTGDVNNFNLDDDNDGYSNGDETANATDPCSSASKPDDFDGDLISDLRDSDDDGDGLSDIVDKFAWDKLNGTTTDIPLDYPLLNGNPGFGFFGLGFTGLMTNNTTDYQNNFDPNKPNLVMGGAVGIATVPAEAGDPTTNNQKYAFQFGIDVTQSTPAFTIRSKLLGSSFFDGATGSQLGTQSQGIYFGTGDQNNYMKIVLHANNNNPGFQILIENAGVVSYQSIFPVSNILSASSVDVLFEINPANGAVQCKYQTNSASSPVNIGPAFTLTGNMLAAVQNNSALAVGLIASAGNKTPYTASWDYIKITSLVQQSLSEVIRINAGGPAIQFGTELWKADQYFTGGSTFSKTNAISNTTNDALYQTERYGNITYNIPVPQSGQYTVQLHFAEINFTTAGSRVFNLNVENGEFALQNIDLFKDYGGSYTASFITASNVQVSDGNLTITLTNVVNYAKISGIAVFLQSSGTPVNRPPTVTKPTNVTLSSGQSWTYQVLASDPDAGAVLTYSASNLPSSLSINASTGLITGNVSAAAGTYTVNLTVKDQQNLTATTSFVITVENAPPLTEIIRINAGGPNLQFGAELWKADQYFTGGSLFSKTNAISNTTNDALYQTERYGNMSYNIPVPQSGQYTVQLHFAEIHFTAAGARVFNVNVENGEFTLQNIDIFKDYGGSYSASVVTASNVQVSDGLLSITFTNVVDNAKISAIAVFLQSASTNQAPTANAGPNKTITLPTSSVILDGSGADPEDGTAVTFNWTQVSGPSTATFSNALIPNPTVSNLTAGTYLFSLTVKDKQLLNSSADQVSVTVNSSPVAQQLVSFTLVNASNEQDIQVLGANAVLNLATLPSQSLNIRANTNPATVGRVVLALSGAQTVNRTETGSPYSLFGDSNGNYAPWTPAVGSYTLTGTPYTSASGGTAGTPLTISFTVVNQTNQPPVVTKPPNASVVSGQSFNYQVVANDPEGTVLNYSATSLPAGLTINSSTGLISGTVTAAAAAYTVNISVKDLQNLTSTTSFVLTVTNPNRPPVITTPPNASVVSGQSFTYQVVANDPDGTALIYSAANLPAGLTIHSTSGLISGSVSAAAGSYTVVLTVRDQPGLTASTSFNIAVGASNQPPVVTKPPNAVINQGQPFSYQVIASDPEGTALIYSASALPAGLTISSATGLISGTVSAPVATYTVTVTVKDQPGLSTSSSFTVTVNPPLPTPQLVSFTLVNAANEQDIQTLTANSVLNLASLPSQSLNIRANTSPAVVGRVVLALTGAQTANRTETGAPYSLFGDTNGNYASWTPVLGSYTLTGTPYPSASGGTAGTPLSITFSVINQSNQPPVVTKPPNASVVTGQGFSYQVIASDPEGTALTYSATNLPTGLTVNSSTGLISGTVTAAAAVFTVNISVRDAQNLTSTTSFILTVTNPNLAPVITTPPNANVISGQTFSYQVIANDPEGTPLTYSATNLPAALSINSSTGLISGMVNASAGINTVVVTVRDQPGLTASTSFTISISNPNQPPLVTTPPNATVTAGQSFSYQVIASDPEGTTLTYQAINLPADLLLSPTSGLISGTVNASAGDYTVSLSVQDVLGLTVNKSFLIKVVNPNRPPVITQPLNQNALRNTVFTYQVIASDPDDGQVGLVYGASGLPAGLSITADNGQIRGIVTADVGEYNVLLGVADKEGLAGEGKSFTITVSNANQPPEIVQPADQTAVENEQFSYQVQASDPEDGVVGLVYSANGLPADLSIDAGTGVISGTVTAVEGNYSVTLNVTDKNNLAAESKSFEIRVTIANRPPIITNTNDVFATRNQSFTYQIIASDPEDGQNSLVYSASGLPTGLSVSSSSGVISGAVSDVAGEYLVTLDAQDKEGLSATDVIVKITVLNENQPPSITNPGNQTAVAGDQFSLQIAAVDPELDNVIFSASGLPSGLAINSTGAFSGAANNSSGDYSAVVTATDSKGAAAQTTFVIKVNNRPVITPIEIILSEGELLQYQVTATDADAGSVFSYSLSEASEGLSIEPDGLIDFMSDDVGTYTAVLTVTDGSGLSATTDLTINVVDQPGAAMSTKLLPLQESLNITSPKFSKDLLTVFPNPIDNQFAVNFYVKEKSEWKFLVYSINGNKLQLPKYTLEKGVATVRFDLSSYNLIPGVYYLMITSTLNDKKTTKLIIN